MKRILLLCFLLCATGAATLVPQTILAQTVTPYVAFNSRIDEYKAGISRGVASRAQVGFNGAMALVATHIADVTAQLNAATNPTVIAQLTAKKNAMQSLQTDLQGLQTNIVSNAATIETKLYSFLNLI